MGGGGDEKRRVGEGRGGEGRWGATYRSQMGDRLELEVGEDVVEHLLGQIEQRKARRVGDQRSGRIDDGDQSEGRDGRG